MRPQPQALMAALALVSANPLMKHMRQVAYKPVDYNSHDTLETQKRLIEAAQAKRDRKNAKRAAQKGV